MLASATFSFGLQRWLSLIFLMSGIPGTVAEIAAFGTGILQNQLSNAHSC